MAFQPMNLGNVLAQAEQIKGLRASRDPNNPQNQLRQLQIDKLRREADAPETIDPTKALKALEAGVAITERMQGDPSYLPTGVEQLKGMGLLGADFSMEGRNPLELVQTLPNLQQTFIQGLERARAAAAGPETFGQPVAAVGPEGNETFLRAGNRGTVEPMPGGFSPRQRAPLVEINRGEELTAEQKAMGKQNAAWYGSLMENAQSADQMISNVRQMQSIDVDTGALEPAKARVAAIAQGFGIDASGIANATNAQSFQAISNRLVNDVLNQAKGPQTEGDAMRARSTIAGLGNTPEARRFIENTMLAAGYRIKEQADYIDEQLAQGVSIRDARRKWRKFAEETPNLSDHVKGPDGLPVFFFQFVENARGKRPGISDAEILQAWRRAHGGS